ncbi:MAG: hypothetical protein L0H54_07195 [Alcaligenaceae bacterium]|nr:hypothetical protein [Alcaligenaceae bacterium]
MDLVPVYAPRTESEAAVITSLMQAYNVEFFIRGGAFSKMYPGPVATDLNAQMLMVHRDDEQIARQLLAPFMENT